MIDMSVTSQNFGDQINVPRFVENKPAIALFRDSILGSHSREESHDKIRI